MLQSQRFVRTFAVGGEFGVDKTIQLLNWEEHSRSLGRIPLKCLMWFKEFPPQQGDILKVVMHEGPIAFYEFTGPIISSHLKGAFTASLKLLSYELPPGFLVKGGKYLSLEQAFA